MGKLSKSYKKKSKSNTTKIVLITLASVFGVGGLSFLLYFFLLKK